MNPGKRDMLFLVLLIAGVWITYLPTLDHPLIWDSKPLIEGNSSLQENTPISVAFTRGYWQTTSARFSGSDYYRPLVVASFMAEKHLWGLSPFRLRLVNLLIFSISLIFLFFLLKRQNLDGSASKTAQVLTF